MHKISEIFSQRVKPAIERSFKPDSDQPSAIPSESAAFPCEKDLYRYRKQRGVNLGSWFVLERWIAESPFRSAQAPGQSDLDVARGSNAKEILEHHWDTWITEADWKFIAESGINTVRIPIGFYHICGADPSVLQGTDFSKHGAVFEGAWSRITNAIATAHRYGIGVLVDLHSAPGKQNNDSHSGSSSSKVNFFSSSNMKHTIHVLSTLLNQLNAFTHSQNPVLTNIAGIELLNEPQHHDNLKSWYRTASQSLRSIDADLPIYIGDSWRTDEYTDFIASLNSRSHILDHHLYRCFTGEDIHTSVWQHVGLLRDPNAPTPQTFARVSSKLNGAGGGLIVGEWSAALNPGSLQGISGSEEIRAKRAYVDAQLDLFDRYCAGWFFWTYKKEHGHDTGWSWKDAVNAGVFPSRVGLIVRNECERDAGRSGRRSQAMDKALSDHTAHWSQWPGNYEHWRFADGFNQGWDDAYEYFLSRPNNNATAGKAVSELGFKGAWAKRRVKSYGTEGSVWEYEHGLMQGIDAAVADFANVFGRSMQ